MAANGIKLSLDDRNPPRQVKALEVGGLSTVSRGRKQRIAAIAGL